MTALRAVGLRRYQRSSGNCTGCRGLLWKMMAQIHTKCHLDIQKMTNKINDLFICTSPTHIASIWLSSNCSD